MINKHFDKVFCISLPSREDRREVFDKHMHDAGIEYEFIDGLVDVTGGAAGLTRTVRGLLNHCIEKRYEQVLIMEDDCQFMTEKFSEIVDKALAQAPPDADLIYLGVNIFQEKVELYSPNLIKIDGGWALHAVIYKRSGMIKVLNAIKNMKNKEPLDTLIVKEVQIDNKCFAVYPMLCTQKAGYSDIEGKRTNYSRLLEERFALRTKKFQNNETVVSNNHIQQASSAVAIFRAGFE
jgi:GR25 family glycosyltransferase involved in LPS biosynthesis